MLQYDLATVTGRPEHHGGVFRRVDFLGGDGWRSFEIWHGNDPKKRSYQYSLFACNPDIMAKMVFMGFVSPQKVGPDSNQNFRGVFFWCILRFRCAGLDFLEVFYLCSERPFVGGLHNSWVPEIVIPHLVGDFYQYFLGIGWCFTKGEKKLSSLDFGQSNHFCNFPVAVKQQNWDN